MKPEDLIRKGQCETPPFGGVFTALYTFVARTDLEFFRDTPDMPTPVLTFEKLPGKRVASYTPQDTTTLRHVIRLDPWKAQTAWHLCEPLVHELVHLWEAHCGYEQGCNFHHDRFHERMAEMGIGTTGRHGRHRGYIDELWESWMEENGDLRLYDYELPGMDAPPRRRMIRYECPDCGFSFNSRRTDVEVECFCAGTATRGTTMVAGIPSPRVK